MTRIADDLYMQWVKEAGLFGKAFFGERKTRKEGKKLYYLWNKALKKEAEELEKALRRAKRGRSKAVGVVPVVASPVERDREEPDSGSTEGTS